MFPSLVGGPEGGALFGGEDFVDAELGGIHLTADGGLQLGLAFEERIEGLGLVALEIHIAANAVAHSALLPAKGLGAFFRVAGNGLYLAFLLDAEVVDQFSDFGTFLFRAVGMLWVLGGHGEGQE